MILLNFDYIKIPLKAYFSYAYLYENFNGTSFRIRLSNTYEPNAFKVINSHVKEGYVLITGRNVWRRVVKHYKDVSKLEVSNYLITEDSITFDIIDSDIIKSDNIIKDINIPIRVSKYGTVLVNKCIKYKISNSYKKVLNKSKLWRECDSKIGILEEYISVPKQFYTDGVSNYLILCVRKGLIEVKKLKGSRYRKVGGEKLYYSPEELINLFVSERFINKNSINRL